MDKPHDLARFGQLLGNVIADNGQGLTDVAYMLGCHRVEVWRWIRGKNAPNKIRMRALLAAYPVLRSALHAA